MKKMLAFAMTMLFAVPAIMAMPDGVILGENNVIVEKTEKVTIYEVKSASMTEPVDWLGGMKSSTLELTLTVEGNVCPAKESDVAFFLNYSDPTYFKSPATLELLSYYKYPVSYGCAAYSQRTDVTVRIKMTVADFESFDWPVSVPFGIDGRDGVKKVVVSVKPPFKFSVQIM